MAFHNDAPIAVDPWDEHICTCKMNAMCYNRKEQKPTHEYKKKIEFNSRTYVAEKHNGQVTKTVTRGSK